MTVKEILYQKYLHHLKTMNKVTWENTKYYAAAKKMHLAKYMYLGLEITATDIKENGGWSGDFYREIKEMQQRKELASNQNRQYNGQVTKFWLTEKGFQILNTDHSICE